MVEQAGSVRRLKPAESQALIASIADLSVRDLPAPQQASLAVAALGMHGLRRIEICRLKPDCFDDGRMLLHVKTAKGGVNRTIRLNAWCVDAIRPFQTLRWERWEQTTFFCTARQKPWAVNQITRAWERGQWRWHWPQINFHGLRHSYAWNVWCKTKSILDVRDALGHRHLRSTEFYLRTIGTCEITPWQPDVPAVVSPPAAKENSNEQFTTDNRKRKVTELRKHLEKFSTATLPKHERNAPHGRSQRR